MCLNNWYVISSWVYKVLHKNNIQDTTYLNTLTLISDFYYNRPVKSIRYICIACSIISSHIIEICPPIMDKWLRYFKSSSSERKLIKYIDYIIKLRCGSCRVITPIDVIANYNVDDIHIINYIAIIAYMMDPIYISQDQLSFCMGCADVALKLKNDMTITSQMSISIFKSLIRFFENSDLGVYHEICRLVCQYTASSTRHSIKLTNIPTHKNQYQVPDDYEIGDHIGSGSYGEVMIGYSRERSIAIKRQPKIYYSSILRELQVLALCSHSNIINCDGFVISTDTIDIYLELGTSLYSVVYGNRDQYSDWYQIYIDRSYCPDLVPMRHNIYIDIIAGVKYLHSLGIIHRDIKISNIVLVDDVAKLIDFGGCELIVLSDSCTREKEIETVTVSYRCPELLLLRNNQSDLYHNIRILAGYNKYAFGIDIWSVGVCMLEMEMGGHPFPHIGKEMKNGRHCNESNVLLHITKILGPPIDDPTFPYDCTGIGLDILNDLCIRSKIGKMLTYSHMDRTLD